MPFRVRGHQDVAIDQIKTFLTELKRRRVYQAAAVYVVVDPELPAAHTLEASISYKNGDLQNVIRAAKRAVALDPNDTDALFWLGTVYAHVRHNPEARTHADHLLTLDPLGY
jgi:Flp pilus assembly protein TadD